MTKSHTIPYLTPPQKKTKNKQKKKTKKKQNQTEKQILYAGTAKFIR